MEQNKLETQFKKKLNSREIKPTDVAWDKLDAMLTAEEKKSKNKFSWIYIAASIVGFLLVGTLYFTQKENTIESQKSGLVISPSIPEKPSKDSSKVLSPNFDMSENKAVANVQKGVSKDNKTPILKKDSLNNKNNQNPVAEFSIINQKKEQFASSNTNEKSIDEMLASVKPTLKAGNLKTTVKVNPNTLLSQVDGELELSFREKVINKVNKNYQTVKVALTNRNQE